MKLQVLDAHDAESGICFLQVAPGTGDVRFRNYNFDKGPAASSGAAAYGYYPGVAIAQDHA